MLLSIILLNNFVQRLDHANRLFGLYDDKVLDMERNLGSAGFFERHYI